MLTSSKYIFLPFPWSMNHCRSRFTIGQEASPVPKGHITQLTNIVRSFSPVEASCAKKGNMWMSIKSMASRTFWAPPYFWYPYAISLTVTGMLRPERLDLAEVTCWASWFGVNTESKSGSEPNWTPRVMNLAFGFWCKAEKSVSRRPFHRSSPSKPN